MKPHFLVDLNNVSLFVAGGNVSDGVETLRRRNTGGSAIVETYGGANANINQGQGEVIIVTINCPPSTFS